MDAFRAILAIFVLFYPPSSSGDEDYINGGSGVFEELERTTHGEKESKFLALDSVGLPGSSDEEVINHKKSDEIVFLDGQTNEIEIPDGGNDNQQKNNSRKEKIAKRVLDEETLAKPREDANECVGPSLKSLCGLPGRDGLPGVNGNPGIHGIPGIPGRKGEPGQCDCRDEVKRITQSEEFFVPNIRQCAWNKLNYAMQVGKISTCTFTKRRAHTSLKVAWHGTARVLCKNSSCCSRWYFTFNGGECITPQPIEGLIFVDDNNTSINIHRSMTVAGLCSDIPKGSTSVGFWVGPCDGGYRIGNSRTGWNSVARIIIEELPLS